MSAVYIVTDGSYSDYHVVAVYDDKQRAERHARLLRDHSGSSDAAVDEWLLNGEELPTPPPGLKGFAVQMKPDGEVTWRGAHDTFEIMNGSIRDHDLDYRTGVLAGLYPTRPFTRQFYMLARDAQHAIKIANERRAMLLAGPEPWPPPVQVPQPQSQTQRDPARVKHVFPEGTEGTP